ncbi:hypothetical protein HUT16_05495 [Kitasatospora sp. NA04385]|uniref:hypothetical protein n=1 Tax=Kitasatospora sp. NA04385 TaxID=2742135 RepID=UPI0015927882|nr:hypothetical protein [Kitasatospora sp. NA04385]QKW18588.1 hypothetical protein HUT16_05495 [Kitasatospora sp. NA04385]
MIAGMETGFWTGDADGPVGEVLRLVSTQVPELVIRCLSSSSGRAGFSIRLEDSLEAVEIEYQAVGESPFIVSDEYSWVQVDDPAAAAEAVLGLLRA